MDNIAYAATCGRVPSPVDGLTGGPAWAILRGMATDMHALAKGTSLRDASGRASAGRGLGVRG